LFHSIIHRLCKQYSRFSSHHIRSRSQSV
ncbi:MAG: hypothetical protein ACPHK7_01375, partial [Candidatus Thalassarchaeaceae archaeon]